MFGMRHGKRRGPNTTDVDRWWRDRTPAYGPVWEELLRSLWRDSTVSLRALSRRLGVDPKTVIRQARRLDLHLESNSGNY